MTKHLIHALLLVTLLVSGTLARSQAPAPQTRGQLLYTTHCIACHDTQVHWRNGKLAANWGSLVAQVRRWQGVAGLQWSDADTRDVARNLNDTIYHFPEATPSASMALPGSQREGMK